MEIYRPRNENNKLIDALTQCKIAFECKQKRVSDVKFWNNYENLSKHERMRCLLCVSGITHVPMGKDGD